MTDGLGFRLASCSALTKNPDMHVGTVFPCSAILFFCVPGLLAASPDSQLPTLDGPCFLYRGYYYTYVPKEHQWAAAEKLCRQRFGFLATIATVDDNQKTTNFMKSIGVEETVWIGAKVKEAGPGTFGSHILTFSTKTDTKYAKLLRQFPQMHSVTICAQVQFDSSYVGVSTVFSYSIPSFINEFQLRANIVHDQQIQLALLVHGVHTPYSQAVKNDGRWHHVCLSWTSHGGSWAIAADGSVTASGDHLYISEDIGAGGVFIIGQEQDTFGGSFKKDESFIGNITQLHIWDRLLNASEIQALAGDCVVVPLGLYFQWNLSAFEIESTVHVHKGFSQCKDYLLLNRSDYPQDVMSADYVTNELLQAADESHARLTSVDLLALIRFLGNVAELDFETEANNSKAVLSLAANYVKLASKVIDPKCSMEWLIISEVIPGPYVIIQSIDMLTEKLSGILLSIKTSIVLSTDNIDVQMKASQLSSLENGLIYKPTCLSARDRVDEVRVPGSEISRLFTSGYEDLIFIHAYYRSVEHHLAPHNVDSVLVAGRTDRRISDGDEETYRSEVDQLNEYCCNNKPALNLSKSKGLIVNFRKGKSKEQTPVLIKSEQWKSIPKSDRTSIHKNLFVALIAAQVVLLSSDSATDNETACTAVTALLHLFFMAAFAWMMVEGLLLWSKVVTVNLSEERRMKYYYLIGWGIPVLIVTITLAAAHDKYIADRYCWLNVHNGVIWAFVGPVIFIIMVNMFVLTRVVLITMSTAKRRAIMLAVNSSPMEQAYDQIRAAVKAVLVLLPILGLTWLCGVLVPFSVVMAYIFVILNSLQPYLTSDLTSKPSPTVQVKLAWKIWMSWTDLEGTPYDLRIHLSLSLWMLPKAFSNPENLHTIVSVLGAPLYDVGQCEDLVDTASVLPEVSLIFSQADIDSICNLLGNDFGKNLAGH
ncbi:adhesion G protein-coupled receptor D2 [Mobula birostris]|uniref:adhesion G protein-coupled receptor D2 n=1 Tax=Mobula birostris TaxID=1983395 RepID=UPI003B284AE4